MREAVVKSGRSYDDGGTRARRALLRIRLTVRYEIELLLEGTARRATLESKRDALWSDYVTQGGKRPPEPDHATELHPSFQELEEGSAGDAVEELQKQLGMGAQAQTSHFEPVTRRRLED